MIHSDLFIKPDPSQKTLLNKQYYEKNNPFPVRLGEFKIPMLQWGNDLGHSLHHVVVKACEEYCVNHGLAFVARNKRIIPVRKKVGRKKMYYTVGKGVPCQLDLQFQDN